MDRNVHFERMRETGKIVIPLIKDAYIKLGSQNNHLLDSLNYYVSRRTNIDQCLLRPYLVRLGYELTGKTDWINIAPACAAVEMLNISTYQSNIVFDNKNGKFTHTQKSNQFISSMLSLELAIESIMQLEHVLDNSIVSRIIDGFHETNRDIYIGQFYDLNELSIDRLDLNISEDDYLKTYIRRCETLGGTLTMLCLETGYLLGEGDTGLVEVIRCIGKRLGTAGQIVNDISDYIPEEQLSDYLPSYKPQFSDFRGGKITYPLLHLIKHAPAKNREELLALLTCNKLDSSHKAIIVRLMCNIGSVMASKKIIWHYYKMLRKEIRQFPKSRSRDLLSVVFSSLLTNKYFAILRTVGVSNAR